MLGKPDIGLFATRLNHQLPRYVAGKPGPGAEALDAFVAPRGHFLVYFSIFQLRLISRVLRKIENEKATAIVGVPLFWPIEPWFPKFLKTVH